MDRMWQGCWSKFVLKKNLIISLFLSNFSNPKDYYAQLSLLEFTVNIAHRYMKHLAMYQHSSVEYDILIVEQTELIIMRILHQKSIVDKNK